MSQSTTPTIKSLTELIPPPFSAQKNGKKDALKKTKPKSMRTLHAEVIREKIAHFTASKIDGILEAMERSATGNTWVSKESKDGTFKSQLPPDVNAAKLLIETTSGRPTQQVEMKAVIGIVDLVQQLEEED